MRETKTVLSFLVFCVFTLIVTACTGNVKDKSIVYSQDSGSPHANITISLELKEIPEEIQTIYFENIQFSYHDDWTPLGDYVSDVFDFELGDERRFAFNRVNSGNVFVLTVQNGLLNVDEWVEQGNCPFKKIQLQGFFVTGVDDSQLPNVLDIPFPCNLDSLKDKEAGENGQTSLLTENELQAIWGKPTHLRLDDCTMVSDNGSDYCSCDRAYAEDTDMDLPALTFTDNGVYVNDSFLEKIEANMYKLIIPLSNIGLPDLEAIYVFQKEGIIITNNQSNKDESVSCSYELIYSISK